MNKKTLIISVFFCIIANVPVFAETYTYRFIPNQSTVLQTGGFAGIQETHNIKGQFQLTVDFGRGSAKFDWVDAILSDSPFLPTRSLGELYFMPILIGTLVDDNTIEFVSPILGPFHNLRLTLSLRNDSARLTGSLVELVADGFRFDLDAVATKVSPDWTYNYFDDFSTDKAKEDSYNHSIFWPRDAFPPHEPYLYYDGAGDSRALAFIGYQGQPAHLGYRFPIGPGRVRRTVKGILKLKVIFPSNANTIQSPPGYLLYSVSSDGQNWSVPEELRSGHHEISLVSLQETCYILFLGTRVKIDNLSVHLHRPSGTIHVPADYDTIQDAIDAADDGDVIEVAPGIYRGNGNRDITFRGKAITVRSTNGPEQTIIDCMGQNGTSGSGGYEGRGHRGFYFHQAEKADSVLRGFTIRGGRINGSVIPPDDMRWNLSPSHPIGGGIYCEYSSPTIVDCVIRDCSTEIGGGIGCVGGEPAIVDCLVENCTAGGFVFAESGGRGGGIGLIRGANAEISNCIIRNNTVYHWGMGAGIYWRRSSAVVTDCEISFNGPRMENGFMSGGGVYCTGPQTKVVLRNCVISHNSAIMGSGLYTEAGINITDCSAADCPVCRVEVTNCTVAHNRLIPSPLMRPTADGAIQSHGSDIRIMNSIVWYNEGLAITLIGPASNSPVNFCDVQGGYPGGIGNINKDPLFAPTAIPDYHLQSVHGRFNPRTGEWEIDTKHSPCIDAGNPKSPVGHEPYPNGRRINMGAYGGTRQASKSTSRVVYHVDKFRGNDNNNGLSRAQAFARIQRGVDAAKDGDIVLVWPGFYTEEVAVVNKAITIQSASKPAVVTAPNSYAFSFFGFASDGSDSVLRNFVIRNCGQGGIYCEYASPDIHNMTIVDNPIGVYSWNNANPQIANSILWYNTFDDLFQCQASYSCIEKPNSIILEYRGNISQYPLFADPNNNDYHLRSRHGRYQPAGNTWVIDEKSSPCIDAADPNVRPKAEPMPNGGRLNMGAYGGTAYASKSKWKLRGDMNFDGFINMKDYAIVAQRRKNISDVNLDGVINKIDVALLARYWLTSLPWAEKEKWQIDDIEFPMNSEPTQNIYRYGY